MTFIGRDDELSFLRDSYEDPRAQLIIMYGRRRIGKTETLVHFSQDKPTLFFAAQMGTRREQLAEFSRRMFEEGAPAGKYLSQYDDWRAALEDLAELPTPPNGKRRLVVIDEFPYLVRSDPSLPSILQNLWDHKLRHSNLMLVLCGSAMSFIEKEILSEKAPLYGRATGVMKMRPMPYWDAARFFPDYTDEDKALAYAMLGGVPQYLGTFNPERSLEWNAKRYILRRGSALYSEPDVLMREEFRETAKYSTIIRAIALGDTRLNDIATHTLIPANALGFYLSSLIEVGIAEREFPVTAKPAEHAKGTRGLYRLADDFFAFWYSFVYPNRSQLDGGDVDGVWRDTIQPALHNYASHAFERMCAEWLMRESRQGKLPYHLNRAGRWWDKTDEMDVVGLDHTGRKAIAGECKFRSAPMDPSMLNLLRARAAKLGAEELNLYLFSLGGFTRPLTDIAAADDSVRLVSLDAMME
ncbi:ATP-binding protein [Bifidobacterium avesanii]|uniref:ATP-binding protein n=1 Tax=Bifidobacterium avesanii TaxID=1798157 RepID=A0A7K3TM76_9BIFI|nr:ATP-binding protein [Bifidobacterium avesanii]KAB8286680.1 AAA family ATPase [Bifidobacterium avesanii]NEG79373.1 ATP-binding protein [Bifidobacterium avesanii]